MTTPDIVDQLRSLSYGASDIPERAAAEIRRLRAEVASKDKQFEDYVRRMEDDTNSMSAEADAQIAALKAEVERLRAALEEIVKPGGADDFWQCVAIAIAALDAARPAIRREALEEAATELDLRAYNTLADVIRDLMEKNNED